MKTILVLLAAVCAFTNLHAAERTWTAGGGNEFWSTPNNWSPAGPPQNGELLRFPRIGPVTIPMTMVNDLVGLRPGLIIFGGTSGAVSYTLNGNALHLGSPVLVGAPDFDTETASVTLNCPLVLEGETLFQISYGGDGLFSGDANRLYLRSPINLNGHDLAMSLFRNENERNARVDISGTISGAGDVRLHAQDTCVIEFNGSADNTFTGKLSYNGETDEDLLSLNKTGGTVVPGLFEIEGRVRLYRDHQIGDGATVRIIDGGTFYFQGHNETVQNLELVDGGVNDSDVLLDTQGGTLTVLGRLSSNAGAGTPTLRGRLDLATDLTCDINGALSNGLDIQAVVSGGGNITKTGIATLVLSGNNTFTGFVFVDNGGVEPTHVKAFGSATSGVVLRGGFVRLNNFTITGESLTVNQSGSTLSAFGTSTWAGAIRLNQRLLVYGENLTLAHAVTGPGGLFLLGNIITLASIEQNTFTGATEVRCERLQLNKPSNVRAFSGPLVVGGSAAPLHEVRWLNHYQMPPGANVTVNGNALLALNNFTDIAADLTFNGGRINLATDSALQITGTVTSNPTNTTALIDGATGLGSLFLAGIRTFNIGRGGLLNDLQIDARIAGSGLIKNGEGTLALHGPNQFGGAVTINNGILRADSNTALGTTGAGTTVNNGGTLWLDANADNVPEPVTLNGSGFGGTNGALTAVLGVTLSGNVLLQTPSTIHTGPNTQFTISSVIGGTGPLTKTGSGALTFAGTSANTYSGDTLVTAGALQLDKSDFTQAIPGSVVIGGTGVNPPLALVRHFSQDQIWTSVTVSGGGLLDLNGHDEYLVALNLNSGGDVSTGTGLLTLLPGNSLNVIQGIRASISSISGRLGLRVGDHIISVAPFLAPLFDGTPELDLSAAIVAVDGVANISKAGAGAMRLGGNSTFTGTLNVSQGQVIAAHNNALGATQGSISVRTNGALALEGGITTGDFLIVDTASPVALRSINGSNTVDAPIHLVRPSCGFDVAPGGFLQVIGSIGGPGGLTKLGEGTLQFWGVSGNSYSGITVVNQGVIEGGRINRVSIPGNVVIGDNSTGTTTARVRSLREQQFHPRAEVLLNSSGSLDLSPSYIGQNVPPAHETLRALRGSGRVFMAVSNSLTFSNDLAFEFAGSIGGSGALNKRGPAAATMTGSGLFTGPTTIHEGSYVVHGNFPNTPVTVNAGSLGGDGVVKTIWNEGFALVGPESEFPGRLGGELEASGLTLNNISFLALDLFGPHATGGNDSLAVNGPVFIAGFAILSTSLRYAPREGDVITLIRKLTAGPIDGGFGDWPQGATRLVGGVPMHTSYTGGDGNDLTLTVTNLAARGFGYRVESGNGNGLVEPDECNLLHLGVQNRRNAAITLSNVVLRSTTPGAFVTIAEAAFPMIPALGSATNLTPFQLRTLPDFPCNAPVTVELQVTVANEGIFAIPFTLLGGTNCNAGGGGCESCHVVSAGRITNGLPTMTQRFVDTGSPSTCTPPKPCPGMQDLGAVGAVRYVTHRYTNGTASDVCVTALLQRPCDGVLQKLQSAAYLGAFNPASVCTGYLGDSPTPGVPFSFSVPAGQPFEIAVCEFFPAQACSSYSLEVFGLPCAPPALEIVRDAAPENVLLQWSTAYPEWHLQSTNVLRGSGPGAFGHVATTAAVVDGKYTITNAVAQPGRFFRLAR